MNGITIYFNVRYMYTVTVYLYTCMTYQFSSLLSMIRMVPHRVKKIFYSMDYFKYDWKYTPWSKLHNINKHPEFDSRWHRFLESLPSLQRTETLYIMFLLFLLMVHTCYTCWLLERPKVQVDQPGELVGKPSAYPRCPTGASLPSHSIYIYN